MDLSQLKVFISVANNQSITKAAEDLFISQPAISVAIQKLEIELGHYLFQRKSRGMELTEFGKEVYNEAVKIEDILNTITLKAKEADDKIVIRVVAVSSYFFYLLPNVNTKFAEKYPNVTLLLEELPLPANFTNISAKDYSFILTAGINMTAKNIAGVSKKNTMETQLLYIDQTVAYCNFKHPCANQAVITEDNLAKYPLAIQKSGLKFIPENNKNLSILMNKESIKKTLANSTEYIGLLPSLFAYEDVYIDSGLLVVKPLEKPWPEAYNYVCYDKMRLLSQPERYFLELLISESRELTKKLKEIY